MKYLHVTKYENTLYEVYFNIKINLN